MSAPMSHDPITVTTSEGTRWIRAAVTREGRGLYRPELAPSCPQYVMATLEELAEHGIKGQEATAAAVAELGALPMPVAGTLVEENARLRARVAELEAAATVLEVPRAGSSLPLQLRRSYGHTDRWAICDREGRRWTRGVGWCPEPGGIADDRLRDEARFTLAEALPLARQLAVVAEQEAVRLSVDAQFPTIAAFLAEDPHDSDLHHSYELGRDLPPFDEAAQVAAEALASRDLPEVTP